MNNFEILIVSAVKICKQCLQTASAFHRPLTGASPLKHTGRLPSRRPPGLYPSNENLWRHHCPCLKSKTANVGLAKLESGNSEACKLANALRLTSSSPTESVITFAVYGWISRQQCCSNRLE